MKNKFLILVVFVFFVSALASGMLVYRHACSDKNTEMIYGVVAGKTEQELILDSDLIIKGTIIDISDGKWTNPEFKIKGKNNIIRSDIIIKTDEVIFGEYDRETVALRVDQGYDRQNKVMHIAEYYPEFKIGQKSVFFLKREIGNLSTDEDYFILSGAYQGVYNVENGKLKNEETDKFKEYTIDKLEERAKDEYAKNPNWKKKKEEQQIQIMENNIKLFGE